MTVLDAAGPPRVDHGSLALAGTRAYWLRDEQPQSALLATGSVQVPRRKGGDCRVRGRTVASNAYVRVYARENRPFSSVYYACELERGRTRRLGRWDTLMGGVGPAFALNGHAVAFQEVHCDDAPCTGMLLVEDVRRRATRVAKQYPGPPFAMEATDLVPADDGAVVVGGRGGVVHIGREGNERQLDAGIEPGSLPTAGTRLYWTRDGLPRTAVLP